MRHIYIILITLLLYTLLPIKPYIECNKIHIIKSINITCNNEYIVKYKEVKPNKDENGITYHYKNYYSKNKSLIDAIKEIESDKHFYINKAKINIENCENIEKIKETISLLH